MKDFILPLIILVLMTAFTLKAEETDLAPSTSTDLVVTSDGEVGMAIDLGESGTIIILDEEELIIVPGEDF